MQPKTTKPNVLPSFSLFLKTNESFRKTLEADEIIKSIRVNEKVGAKTIAYRAIEDRAEANSFEDNSFVCLMASGVFTPGFQPEHLQQHSGLIWLHLVNLSTDRMTTLRTSLQADDYAFVQFADITGNGLWVAFRIDYQQPSDQHAFFNQLGQYCHDSHGVTGEEIDPHTQRIDLDIPISHDPAVHHNFNAQVMPLLEEYMGEDEPISVNVENPEPLDAPVIQPTIEKVIETGQKGLLNDLDSDQRRAEEGTQQRTTGKISQTTNCPTVDPFPVGVFPRVLQRVIQENEEHQLFKPDWFGPAIMLTASIAVGNTCGTKWKNYQQKGTIYLAIVGPPGSNKSGPFDYALKPLQETDAKAYQLYKQQATEYDRWIGLSKAQRENEGLPVMMERPVYKAILVSDITPEALVFHHQNNPIGLGLTVDELAAWFNNFNRYSKGSETENWLSNWSFGVFRSFRLGRGANVIEQPAISVGGTIQPGILSELAKDSRSQSGFIDRILFAYPDGQKKPKDSDTELDPRVTDSYHQCINKLLSLREKVEMDENGRVATKWIPFAPDAFKAMRKWRDQNTDRYNNTESVALKGLYAKFDAYIIRFCLILELLDWSCGDSELNEIRLDTVNRAATLAEYFRQNAVKVLYQLNDQTPDERLPADQQRLFAALPDEVSTAEAVTIGAGLTPPVSESTVKRLLRSATTFKRTAYGEYYKL